MAAGGRNSAGLEKLETVMPLKGAFRHLFGKPAPGYMEAVADVAASGRLPEVEEKARTVLEAAEDKKEYGDLRGNPVSTDGVAAIMHHTADDTITDPALYQDMNNICYDKDRRKVMVYCKLIWLILRTFQILEPYRGGLLFRGVKMDLRDQYVKGRKITWHGFSSCTHRP